ncbi:hypothetical protein ASE12_13535 [Aeromicrobium sp. Root236]|uniref:hypothetical protein n=1 Tax=Aeromicrobium sp. Root236 TaxID=1736498 RepID=UPI0006F9F84F|nr:hypothetical protein [Aeromicrobium sp. Root236]KRC65688.1 hypothetical protein ASE12_13535 [Aeromicrobium sp. Root236]
MNGTIDREPQLAEKVPRAVRLAAWATPLCVLPSSVWRLFAIDHIPAACPQGRGTDVYVVGLSIVSFLAALLTVGLVSRWGKQVPSWVPVVGGRPLPYRAVTTAAVGGIAVLATAYLYALLNPVFGWREPNDDVPGCPPPDQTDDAWLAYACYAPLLLWLPLLTFVTVAYWWRRRGEGRDSSVAVSDR